MRGIAVPDGGRLPREGKAPAHAGDRNKSALARVHRCRLRLLLPDNHCLDGELPTVAKLLPDLTDAPPCQQEQTLPWLGGLRTIRFTSPLPRYAVLR